MDTKSCSKCRQVLALSSENFHKCSKSKTGFRGECIKCRTHKTRQYYPTGLTKAENARIARGRRRETLRGYISDNLHNSIWAREKKRGGISDLTTEYVLTLWQQQEGKCFYTGMPMEYGASLPPGHYLKMSFDRINPTVGYIKGNIVLSSNFANRARGNSDFETFRQFIKQHWKE